jgi:hypothetical protein
VNQVREIEAPPSISEAVPVTNDESSDAKFQADTNVSWLDVQYSQDTERVLHVTPTSLDFTVIRRRRVSLSASIALFHRMIHGVSASREATSQTMPHHQTGVIGRFKSAVDVVNANDAEIGAGLSGQLERSDAKVFSGNGEQ